MLVIRPVRLDDLDALLKLATMTGFGLTTLPKDQDLLRERIVGSQAGFERLTQRPRGEDYLFVMEDLKTGAVVATCGVISKVGGFEPFYAYRIESEITESKMLGVRKEIRTLHLVKEHNGPSEVCSLFLSPEYRKEGNGRLLSLSRFLFVAEHRQRFDDNMIAEMRGVIDDRGHSEFWDAIGKHFFEIDFPKADYLSMVNKRFIGELMPKHPIYVTLLPPAAQQVIGQVHEQTQPALKMLQQEGFAACGLIDIFEGGPVVRCDTDSIRTVKQSVRATVGQIADADFDGELFLVGNTRREFRCCKGHVGQNDDGTVKICSATALAIGVKIGEAVRYASMKPAKP